MWYELLDKLWTLITLENICLWESWLKAEEKATTEAKMVGWHHWFDGRVWASPWSWWWTRKPSVLQATGSQRVRHDWATELNIQSFLQVFWLPEFLSCAKLSDDSVLKTDMVHGVLLRRAPAHCRPPAGMQDYSTIIVQPQCHSQWDL